MIALPDSTFHVGILHSDNVSSKHSGGPYWQPAPVMEIAEILGSDWHYYHPGCAAESDPATRRIISERKVPVMAIAQDSDLLLPESVAFNNGQSLPRMRRWELPFVLFQARLADNMSILDCTINPVNFQNRLTHLFPHTLYRHFSPIQNGRFALPLGFPDGAFDRVICVNTLEHLLRTQRESLLAELARKLKPGGRLVLTCEYYFDSCWSEPALLSSGMVRADRQEVFNGFNLISPQECLDTCRRYGLEPLGEMPCEPNEADPGLYCNLPPYRHTCLGAVFTKLPHNLLPEGKKIVLALLTWNTRQASLDSLHAYLGEARMLQRLGHIPSICVCDNGSIDGTVEALQTVEPQVDFPHKFIFNPSNLGSSIARNQIIDYVLTCDAHYVMFLDGDIEVVPFSVFAMLRYMEANGLRLGCIGANSLGQTPNRAQASPVVYSLNDFRIATTNMVAWTQYGLFRRELFDAGVRFDESSPFNQPGWGFEDNDLAYQIETKGFVNQFFSGMTYLHRHARSSVRLLRQERVDVDELFTKRKQYVINKWAAIPDINNGPLNEIRKMRVIL
jgi:hypothetical protein